MMKINLLILCALLSGCAGTVHKIVSYEIECKKCVTPYGKGDDLKIKINRAISVEKIEEKK